MGILPMPNGSFAKLGTPISKRKATTSRVNFSVEIKEATRDFRAGLDAALFSAIYFGAFGIERVSTSEIDIHVHIPHSRDFSTVLVLPRQWYAQQPCGKAQLDEGCGRYWNRARDRRKSHR